MRTALPFVIIAATCLSAWSQAQTPPGAANTAPALGFGSGSDRSVFAKKPKMEDLLQLPRFTNSADVVMVKINPQLWAGETMVTQEQYEKVMGGNPSQFRGAKRPVDTVSYVDALAFCARLNEMETKAEMLPERLSYALPTQAQWESMLGGATLSSAVHSMGTPSRSGTSPVASLPANTLGLYDIRGNLWQWCADPVDKPYRVLRGGAWNEGREVNLRPEFRWYSNGPEEKQNIFGFRVVLTSR